MGTEQHLAARLGNLTTEISLPTVSAADRQPTKGTSSIAGSMPKKYCRHVSTNFGDVNLRSVYMPHLCQRGRLQEAEHFGACLFVVEPGRLLLRSACSGGENFHLEVE